MLHLCPLLAAAALAGPSLTTSAFALPAQLTDPEGAPPGAARPHAGQVMFDRARVAVTAQVPTQRNVSTTFRSLNQDPEGDMPRDAAFTPDGSRVFVVNRDTDTVTVFDFSTRAIVGTITVGDFPVDVEVSPDGSVAATPNLLSDTVSFIDTATLSVIATTPITQLSGSGQPYRVAFDDASNTCVVSVIDGAVTSRFSVIDLATFTETLSFPTTPHGAVGGFGTPESGIFGNIFSDWALAADGSFLLVPDRGGDHLSAYDVATGTQLAYVPVGDVPAYVDIADNQTAAVLSLAGTTDAVVGLSLSGGVPTPVNLTPTVNSAFDPIVRITPDNSYAIVAVQNAVEFIDLVAGTSVSTVGTGSVGDIEFTFDDQYAVVTNFNTRIIDLATRSLVRTLTFAATADAAISPTSHRLVGINNRFAEDLHYYSTDGTSSQFLGRTLSGEEPEVDAPRRVTITPDGTRALITGMTSRSVVDVDLRTGATNAVYPVGDRVWEVATDSAGTVAVVTSTESSTAQVIDLVAGAVVATLNVPTRPTQLAVSPDGTRAYISTVAGTDRIYFVDLAGPMSAITGSIPAGQLGSILFNYNQSSGISLSPDGQTLAVCVSFDDELLLIDTASESELVRVPVGDFPLRAAWSPDGGTIYVGSQASDTVHKVAFAGSGSSVTGIASGVDQAFQVTVGPAGQFLYVGEYAFNVNRMAVIDTATMTRVSSVSLPGRPHSQDRAEEQLFVGAGDVVCRLTLAGAATSIAESITVTGTPADLALSGAYGLVVTTQPGADDGIDVTRFGGGISFGCPGELNSTGAAAQITATGTFIAGGLPLTLTASGLPAGQFGLLLTSQTTANTFPVPNSQGRLCLGGSIGRFNSLVTGSGPAGIISIAIDTDAVPNGPGTQAVQPLDTWHFQLWYRDAAPLNTSNFTNRVSVSFD